MSKNKQLKQAIRKTIKFFETHKWGRLHSYNEKTDAYCVRGAFLMAETGSIFYNTPLFSKFVDEFQHHIGVTPVKFNDRNNQKKQRVVAALQKLHDLL